MRVKNFLSENSNFKMTSPCRVVKASTIARFTNWNVSGNVSGNVSDGGTGTANRSGLGGTLRGATIVFSPRLYMRRDLRDFRDLCDFRERRRRRDDWRERRRDGRRGMCCERRWIFFSS